MAGRNIDLQLGMVAMALKSEVAVEKAPETRNMCVGQPDKEAHEAKLVVAPKSCTSCGDIVDPTLLVKGVKQGSSYAIIQQEDVAEAKAEYALQYKGVLAVVAHPSAQFLAETAPGDSLHYLTPADAATESRYKVMVKLIESHPELAFAGLHTPSSATALFMLRVRDGVLVMEKRTRSQALKPTPSVGGEVNDGMYAQIEGMLPFISADYDPEAYEDKYAAALEDMIANAETVTTGGTETKTKAAVVRISDDELVAKLAEFNSTKSAKKKPAKAAKKKVAA